MDRNRRNTDGLTEAEFLASYKPGDYERPSVTVDMVIMGMNEKYDSLKLLLIQRKNHPYMGCWALPGGFVDMKESAYQAACRELEEETSLTGVYMEQLYTFSQPDRDPRMRVIDIAYLALIPVVEVKAGDDAENAAWFELQVTEDRMILRNEDLGLMMEYKIGKQYFQNGVVQVENYGKPELLTEESLGFDHSEIILESILRMRNKVNHTDIAFNLMQEKFTLHDLQAVYESILGEKLYKANFRRKIASKVIATGEKTTSSDGDSGRPAELYRYQGVEISGSPNL